MKKVVLNSILLGAVLICFTGTFFLNALLQIRKTEGILYRVYESQAKNLVEHIELLAQEMVRDFLYVHRGLPDLSGQADIDTGFRIREAVLVSLQNILWELGKKQDLDLTSHSIQEFLIQHRLSAIAIWNQDGELLGRMGNLSESDLSFWSDSLRREQGEFFIGADSGKPGYYLVAMKGGGKAAWLGVLLDFQGMKHWATREALRLASSEVSIAGVRYISLVGPGAQIVAQWGEQKGRQDPDVLEVSHLSSLDPQINIVVGMELEEISRLSRGNRISVLTVTVIMAIISIALSLFFYTLQQRHSKRLEEMKEALRNEERLSSLGRLARGLAHEIKNPLNAISMVVQRLSLEFSPPQEEKVQEFKELTSLVRSEIKRLKELVDSFIGPTQSKKDFKEEDLVRLLEDLTRLLQEEARSKDLEIKLHYERRPLIVRMDYMRLYQAFLNILKNSLESLSKGGRIEVLLRQERGKEVKISIRDTGRGISTEDLGKIFEIGFTTKEKGLGLGLPLAREIILAHGGQIKVESGLGAGTLFTVTLPLAR